MGVLNKMKEKLLRYQLSNLCRKTYDNMEEKEEGIKKERKLMDDIVRIQTAEREGIEEKCYSTVKKYAPDSLKDLKTIMDGYGKSEIRGKTYNTMIESITKTAATTKDPEVIKKKVKDLSKKM